MLLFYGGNDGGTQNSKLVYQFLIDGFEIGVNAMVLVKSGLGSKVRTPNNDIPSPARSILLDEIDVEVIMTFVLQLFDANRLMHGIHAN